MTDFLRVNSDGDVLKVIPTGLLIFSFLSDYEIHSITIAIGGAHIDDEDIE